MTNPARIQAENFIDLSPEDEFAARWKKFLFGPRQSLPLTSKQIRSVDLFSSVGGLTLGLSVAAQELGLNLKPALAVDIDQKALDVFVKNWPTAKGHRGSVKDLVEAQIIGRGENAYFAFKPEVASDALRDLVGTIDVITAGPPCQGHSSLNNVTRGDDPRNELYLRVPAIAIALDAPIVIIENVPGVVRAVGNVVDTAASLFEKNGYVVNSAVIAADAIGWAQTRKRFFMVAVKAGLPHTLLADTITANRRPPMTIGEVIGDLLDFTDPNSIMTALPEMSKENVDRVNYLFEHDLNDLPLHMRPDCHKEGTSYSASYGRMSWDKPAPTLTTGFMSPGRGRFVHPIRARVMTPREGARVQGFPDWYNFEPEGSEVKKTDLAKWIGDAVPSAMGYIAALSALRSAN